MRIAYQRFGQPGEIVRGVRDLSPRTVIVDVEPLIAYWDTDTAALSQGVASFLEQVSASSGLLAVCFATNSRRRLPAAPAGHALSVLYVASARKPLRTAPYRDLPRPGVLIGDQIATDGALAWRLGYSFIHYCPLPAATPWGPRLMSGAGRLFQPFLFRKEDTALPPEV